MSMIRFSGDAVKLLCLIATLGLAGAVDAAPLRFQLLGYQRLDLRQAFKAIEETTSIAKPGTKVTYVSSFRPEDLRQPWVFVKNRSLMSDKGSMKRSAWKWLVEGGFAVITAKADQQSLEEWTQKFSSPLIKATWSVLDSTSEISKSFFLLKSLPACKGTYWYGLYINKRLAVVVSPYDVLAQISLSSNICEGVSSQMSKRSLVNTIMIALTTDYKNDQIHLPAILKRIR